MARKGGEEQNLERVKAEEHRPMVELGVEYVRDEKKTAEELGETFDLDKALADSAFRQRFPEEGVQAAIREEMLKETVPAVEAASAGAAAETGAAGAAGEEQKAGAQKKRKERKSKKKLKDDEIAALQGEALDAALKGVSVKDAKYFATAFEEVGRPEDALKALTRAWELHDKKDKKDFSDLTSDLVLKIAQIQGTNAAEEFVRNRLQRVDRSLATAATLAIARLITPPEGVKVAGVAAAAEAAAGTRAEPPPAAPKAAVAPRVAGTKKAAEAKKEEPEEYDQTTTGRMLEDMEASLEEPPAPTLYEAVLEEIAAREKIKADEVEKAGRGRVFAARRGELELMEPGTYEEAEAALHALDIDAANPEKSVQRKEQYLGKIISVLEKQISATAKKEDCDRILQALDASFDHYLESLAIEEVKAIAVDSYAIGDRRWEKIFKPLFEGLDKLVKDAQTKREELRAAAEKRKSELPAAEKKKPGKGVAQDAEKARSAAAGARAVDAPAAPRPPEAPQAPAAPRAAAAPEPPRPPPTRIELSEEARRLIAERVTAIKRKIEDDLKAREGRDEKALDKPASWKFGRLLGDAEYTMLVSMAKRQDIQDFLLNISTAAYEKAVRDYLDEFAKAVGINESEAGARLDTLVGEVEKERRAQGGKYVYKSIDPAAGGKRQRLKAGDVDIASLSLAEIADRVSLRRDTKSEAQFAGSLDFLEAARRLQKELIDRDLRAERERREGEEARRDLILLPRRRIQILRDTLAEIGSGTKTELQSYLSGFIATGEAKLQASQLRPREQVRAENDLAAAREALKMLDNPAEYEEFLERRLDEFARWKKDQDKAWGRVSRADREKVQQVYEALRRADGGGAALTDEEQKLLKQFGSQVELLEDIKRVDAMRRSAESLLAELDKSPERRRERFAQTVEFDALLWAADKKFWGRDEAAYERARQLAATYERAGYAKEGALWTDKRKEVLRELVQLVWSRREIVVAKKSNDVIGLDSRAAKALLGFIGVPETRISALEPPARREGAIHINIGGREGVYSRAAVTAAAQDARRTGRISEVVDKLPREVRELSFDHHDKSSTPGAASSQYLFETLEFLGFFSAEGAKNIGKAVELVSHEDNKSHPAWRAEDSPYWKGKWYRTMLGLCVRADFNAILEYVKDHPDTDFTQELSDQDLEKYGLKDKAQELERLFEKAKRHWQRLEEKGYSPFKYTPKGGGAPVILSEYFKVEATSSKFGEVKVVFCYAGENGGGFPGGLDTVRALGGPKTLYIVYNPAGNSFFATHGSQELPEDLFGEKGIRLRKQMWVYRGSRDRDSAYPFTARSVFEALWISAEDVAKNRHLERAMNSEEARLEHAENIAALEYIDRRPFEVQVGPQSVRVKTRIWKEAIQGVREAVKAQLSTTFDADFKAFLAEEAERRQAGAESPKDEVLSERFVHRTASKLLSERVHEFARELRETEIARDLSERHLVPFLHHGVIHEFRRGGLQKVPDSLLEECLGSQLYALCKGDIGTWQSLRTGKQQPTYAEARPDFLEMARVNIGQGFKRELHRETGIEPDNEEGLRAYFGPLYSELQVLWQEAHA